MKSALRCTILLVGLSFAVASAQSPQTQIDAAKAAIKTAQDALTKATTALNAIATTTTTTTTTPTGTTTTIAAGGDLQAALNAAACGATIKLTAGATYTGNFVLPAGKNCTATTRITVTTTGTLPAGRVAPATAAQMPRLAPSPGGLPDIRTAPASTHYTLRGIEFLPLVGGANDIIDIGDGSSAQTTLASVPDDIIIDQCYVHGDPIAGQKRGVGLNGSHVTVSNSYISGIRTQGQDSQAIAGWNGPGPFSITNNYLEAASENVLFGGADPSIAGLVPSNITIAGNYISKPVAWRTGGGWNVKNAIELKSAAHVAINANILENVWADAQSGFALVLTVRNQDGGCPQCTLQDVRFTGNVVRHAGAFVNILALDDNHGDTTHGVYTSVRASGLIISGNLVYDIDTVRWAGVGRIFQVLDGPNGLTIDHNTIAPAPSGGWQNSAFTFQNGSFPVAALIVTNNVLPEGEYGVIGAGDLLGIGAQILTHYAPGFVWTDDAILEGGGFVTGGGGTYSYPTTTTVTAATVLDATYHVLAPAVSLPTTDAAPIGANLTALQATINGLDVTQ